MDSVTIPAPLFYAIASIMLTGLLSWAAWMMVKMIELNTGIAALKADVDGHDRRLTVLEERKVPA